MPSSSASETSALAACPGCYGTFLDGLPRDSALAKFLSAPAVAQSVQADPPEPLASTLHRTSQGLQGNGLTARATLAVLFSDIVGSTAFFSREGDDAGLEMIERHNAALLPVLDMHGGVLIKSIGDALMGAFASATAAAHAAAAMQLALRDSNRDLPSGIEPIEVRIGIHFGEALVKLDRFVAGRPADVFGTLVNVASRIEGLAAAGEILVSSEVASRLNASLTSLCKRIGAKRLKGIPEPIEVFELRWA